MTGGLSRWEESLVAGIRARGDDARQREGALRATKADVGNLAAIHWWDVFSSQSSSRPMTFLGIHSVLLQLELRPMMQGHGGCVRSSASTYRPSIDVIACQSGH